MTTSLIKKPHELEVPKMVKCLIYGQPGSGKSTLALSGPRALHFDFDRGAHRVRAIHRRNTVQVNSWQDVIDVLDKEDLSGFDSFVFDTAGKMLDFASERIIKDNSKMGSGGALNQRGYGIRKAMFRAFFHKVANMGKRMIVFVAHDKEEKEGETKIVRPDVGASSGADLIRELDLVGYMEFSGSKRTISFDPCEKFYGKNTCGLERVINVTSLYPEDPSKPALPNTFLTEVLAKFEGEMAASEVVAAQYAELTALIAQQVEAIATPEDANDFMDRMAEAEHIWDSKFHAAALLRDRARVLGIAIDKTTKKYALPAKAAA